MATTPPDLTPIRAQVYKDPRPKEYFDGFHERSRMLTMDPWRHERTIEKLGPRACRITDRLRFSLRPLPARVPGADRLAATIVAALFRHRHRRLAKLYGQPSQR